MKEVSTKKWNLPISMKHSHEILEFIKNKKIDRSIAYLEQVRPEGLGIPFKKYSSKGHKHGVPTGYPQKATKFIIRMLKELRNNIKAQGFDPSKAVISKYELGRGPYPRYASGAVSRGGKHTNLTIIATIEANETQEKPAAEAKEQEIKTTNENKQNEEVKDDKENNKQSN